MRAAALFDLRTDDGDERSSLDRAIASSIDELTLDPADSRRFAGTMRLSPALTGPPGRVHGGIHPILRTVPILERLGVTAGPLRRIRVDAALQKALPIGTTARFDGHLESTDDDFILETRFLESDRLVARATRPAEGPLANPGDLARLRDRFAVAQEESRSITRIVGIEYEHTPSLVWLDLRTTESIRSVAHVRGSFSESQGFGLAAFSTQLDSVGVLARAEALRHPHFTTRIEVSIDLDGVGPTTPILVLADRSAIESVPGSPTVEVNGAAIGTVRSQAFAVDASFTRCFARARITMHPIDPARFAGFEAMLQFGDPI